MTSTSGNEFADTIAARLIALCIALVLAIILVYNYKDDVQQLLAGGDTTPALPVAAGEGAPETVSNPALAECLVQRIGDVDKMKEEGILSDSQYASFRSRAEELCVQQNQG